MTPIAAAPPPAADLPAHPSVAHRSTHAAAPAHGWTIHQVAPGDTLSQLAVRFRTSVQALAGHNHIADVSMIRAGMRLAVPQPAPTGHHAAPGSPAAAASGTPVRHLIGVRVAPGDTLSAIALRSHSSVAAIMKANGLLDPSRVLAGSTIVVPATDVPRSSKPAHPQSAGHSRATERHVVHLRIAPGDTLAAIAARARSSVAAIMKANHIADPRRVAAGSMLAVPVAGPSPSSRPARSGPATFAGRTYPAAVVRAADAHRRELAGRTVASRSQAHDLIVAAARRNGVDPRLALAIGWQESGWDQHQVSVADAIGVMQVLPGTGEWASQLTGRRLDLLDTGDNITAGVVVLRYLTQHTHDLSHAIAAYYQGLAGVQEHGMYPDTKTYVRSVGALMKRLS